MPCVLLDDRRRLAKGDNGHVQGRDLGGGKCSTVVGETGVRLVQAVCWWAGYAVTVASATLVHGIACGGMRHDLHLRGGQSSLCSAQRSAAVCARTRAGAGRGGGGGGSVFSVQV